MNWVLGLLGAVIGAALSDSREMLGAVGGFFSVFLLAGSIRLRREVAALSHELALLKGRVAAAAAPVSATTTSADAAPAQSSEAPVSAPAPPVVPGVTLPDRIAAATVRPPEPLPEREPGWVETSFGRVKSWFTEGNVPVKIGVLVLLFGVAAALRYAAAQGYFTMSIQVRLAVIAAGAIAALALGWRERIRRPAFGLSLQGGALGALLLTVFAAYRLYGLLPPMLAFTLIVVLVAGSALLAVLQQNMALAVLGFLGGYLAPVLISTGSANHIGLFSYYAVLNAAVFAISWKQSWRLLNLIGFFFTFAVGTAWGAKFYRPELFPSVEPFLILFFLFYIVIGLLYVVRQLEHRRPWVDGTLVFGTPLVAFPLQAAMLQDNRIALAASALVVALIYAALVYWLRQRRGERLLTEAYGALALGFATLAVPLAFSASTTASVWALEGAGVAWIGIRQKRNFPWLAGLCLQLLAAGAYLSSLVDYQHQQADGLLLINADWLGAALLSFSGFLLALVHDRYRPRFGLPPLLFGWGALWWLAGAATQLDLAALSLGQWRFWMLYLVASIATASILRDKLSWPRLNWLVALASMLGLLSVFAANDQYGQALALPTLLPWALYLAALGWALCSAGADGARSLALAHLMGLWTIAIAAVLQLQHVAAVQQLAQGWRFVAFLAPLMLLTLALWRRPALFAWPRANQFRNYRSGWFGLALPLLAYAFLFGLFIEGGAEPLAFLPLLNPLELTLVAVAVLLYGLLGEFQALAKLRPMWPLAAFAFITMATLRAVHHLHGEPWSNSILQSGFTQASLTVVWSLLGVSAWIFGSRRHDRQVWMGGALLMGIVLLKLLTVDRGYMGNMPGIISFMAVGLLLVGVGYIAPSPPKLQETGAGT